MRPAHPYVVSGVSVNKGNGSCSDVLRIRANQSDKCLCPSPKPFCDQPSYPKRGGDSDPREFGTRVQRGVTVARSRRDLRSVSQ